MKQGGSNASPEEVRGKGLSRAPFRTSSLFILPKDSDRAHKLVNLLKGQLLIHDEDK